jgi:outer membrane protein OmpA-like peptidoglycan-associated protein
VVDKSYQVYLACHTQEAIDMTNEAMGKIKALCPAVKQSAITEEAPVVIVVAEPKAQDKVVELASVRQEKVVVLALEDVHFDFDKSTLTDEARKILKKDLQILQDNPKAKVLIAGYTSASGTAEYNMKLTLYVLMQIYNRSRT